MCVLTYLCTGILTYTCLFTDVFTCLFTGVLTRCLVSLEQKDIDGSKSTETSDALREVWWPTFFLQGVSSSCKPCTSYDRDVCLSIRSSITRWYWVKTTQARITKSSPTDSTRNLVFRIKNSSRNSKEFTPSEGVKWEWGMENSQFSANKSPYLRNGAR